MARNYAPKKSNQKGQFIRTGQLELYYEEYGEGAPLLLLHGFGGCVQNWYPFIGPLAEQYRLILVDLRGHGNSNNPQNRFTHREAAEDLFRLLEILGLDRLAAMGMSTGGMVLLHMATNRPVLFTSLVLISATTHFPDQARAIMKWASFPTLPPEVRIMYMECAKRGEEQIRQLIAQFQAMHNDNEDMNFKAGQLSVIPCPTLIIHGGQDQFFDVSIAENMQQSIPDSRLWLIPDGDHVPVFAHPEAFTKKVLSFLKDSGLSG